MTAEVALLNKNAVALAADSKVSVGAGSPEKTYDTVNKIFTLSKVHPVGIMIYGNAEFMGFPWETIVKQYRAANAANPNQQLIVGLKISHASFFNLREFEKKIYPRTFITSNIDVQARRR
jgi:hypothetical protein